MTRPCGLSAETWFLNGQWDYYVLCDAAYRPAFRTASNVIEVYQDLGDGRALIRSTAYMIDSRKGASIPVDMPVATESVRPWYASAPEKAKVLDGLARSIVGDESTVEGAVDRIGAWVRNKVSYSLGTSTDPLEVARTGRAFCSGYANLTVALMRAVGIPAAVLTCYIAPGNGWGAGGSGGDHAFVEYYYPGIGWLCHDPQSTSGYVDPFHLVDFSGKVHAQYRRSPDAYATGYAAEPAAWSTYSAAAPGKTAEAQRGIALKMTDADGKPVAFEASLAMAGLSLQPSRAYFPRNVFGKTWCTSGNDEGVNIAADASVGMVALGKSPGWRSYFLLPGALPEPGEDILVAKAPGQLALRRIDLARDRFIAASFDFSGGKVQRLKLRDPASGRPLPGQRVRFTTGALGTDATTAADGSLSLICETEGGSLPTDFTIAWGEVECTMAFQPGTATTVPEQSRREAELQTALAAARSSAPASQFRLVVRDFAGTADATIVRCASLFDGSLEKRLSPKAPGFLVAEGLEAGRSYVLRACIGGVNLERTIGPIRQGQGTDVEIREAELRPALIARANPFDGSALSMYEYFADNAPPWLLYGEDGTVRWDCPPGDYLVSDNASRAKVMRIQIAAGAYVVYDPASMDLAAYRFAETFRTGKADIAVGVVRDMLGPLGSSTVFVMEAAGPSYVSLRPNEHGYVTFPQLRPSTDYRMAVVEPGRLVLHTFSTDQQGRADVDLRVSGNHVTCHTGARWSSVGPGNVNILLSSVEKGEAVSWPVALATGASFELYADDGSYLLSAERSIIGATVLASGKIDGCKDGQGELYLCPDPRDAGLVARSRAAARLAWPDAANVTLLRFVDGEKDGWKSARVEFRVGDRSIRPAFDTQGFIMLGAAGKNEYRFVYTRAGLRWEGGFSPSGDGPDIVELRPDDASSISLELAAGQTLSLLGPAVKDGKLSLGEQPLVPSPKGTVRIVGMGRGAWLRLKDGRICFCANQRAPYRLSSITMPDQAAAWKTLLGECDTAGIARVIDTRSHNLTPQAALRLGDGKGRTLPFWSPLGGIYLATGLTGQELCLDLSQNGLFVRQAWPLKGPGTEILTVRSPATANISLVLSGPTAKTSAAVVILYAGGKLDGATVTGYTERLVLRTAADGSLAILVPNGVWWIEAGGQCRKVVLAAQERSKLAIAVK
jgi:hypothetical protein